MDGSHDLFFCVEERMTSRSLAISVTFTLFCVLVCSSWANGRQDISDSKSSYRLNTVGKYPVVLGDNPYEFDAIGAYVPMESSGNLRDAAFTEYFEELTNVRVNWIEVIEASLYSEQQNLILASGILPDAFMAPGMTPQQVYSLGRNGTLVRLNELLDRHMPALIRELDEWPEYKAQLAMPDGGIYALPQVSSCYHCTMGVKMWVYKPWIDKLGIEWPPQTTDDFYHMLKALKEKDPNGNGKPDEILLMGSVGPYNWYSNPIEFLMNSYIYTQMGSQGAYLERIPGGVRFVADTDEWRDGLRYLRKLAAEGLLAPETFVQNLNQVKMIAENPDAPLIGAVPCGAHVGFTQNGGESGRYAEYQPIAPLEGPPGIRYTRYGPRGIAYHTKITKSAERPDIICQWADWFYDDSFAHGMLSYGYSVEGVQWRYLTEVEKNLGLHTRNGDPASTIQIVEGTYGKTRYENGWTRSAPTWSPLSMFAMPIEWQTDPSKQEWRLMIATRDLMEPYRSEGKHIPPNLIIEDGVAEDLADLTEAIASNSGIVEVWSTEFIIGRRNIESDDEWNSYVDELDRAGVDRYTELWRNTLLNGGY